MRIVVSLYDYTGIMVKPWADAGYECICVDILHPAGGRFEDNISYINLDLSWNSPAWETLYEMLSGKECIIFGFPPCTDIAVSGAMHWNAKRARDPAFQDKAVACLANVERLANKLKVPFMVENPRGVAPKFWRKPDFEFDPYEYGGYLPPDDKHPLYPNKISDRDGYTKRTCIWHGNGFVVPNKNPVTFKFRAYRDNNGELKKYSETAALTGGNSARTKEIRSATPRGFALAVYYANGIDHASD